MNSSSYVNKNMFAKKTAQLVPMGMPRICLKNSLLNATMVLEMRLVSQRARVVGSRKNVLGLVVGCLVCVHLVSLEFAVNKIRRGCQFVERFFSCAKSCDTRVFMRDKMIRIVSVVYNVLKSSVAAGVLALL